MTAPPSPPVATLFSWKLKAPMSLSPPIGPPRQDVPSDWAQSSITYCPFSRATCATASMSQATPNRCTGMIALVRDVTLLPASAASRQKLGSTSANTGTALQAMTANGDAMNVTAGTMTSSPRPTPSARSATTKAAVPEVTASACVVPATAAICASTLRTFPTTRGP